MKRNKYGAYKIPNQDITLDLFCNPMTLNIFTDASYFQKFKYGGFAAIGVCQNQIIGETSRYFPSSTGGDMELRALRLGLSMACMMSGYYPIINIFSDSSYSVESVRDYIYRWRWSTEKQSYVSRSNKIPAHMELVYECNQLFTQLMSSIPSFNLFYQGAHANPSKDSDMKRARNKFYTGNHFHGNVDYNFIRYISFYNNYVDNLCRKTVQQCSRPKEMHDAIEIIMPPYTK